MFAQTSSVAHLATASRASGDTRDARVQSSLQHATSVRLLLTVSATLIVTAAIFAASFVVYKADGAQLDPHNLAHLRLLLTLISAAGIGAAAALAALLSGPAVAPLRRLAAAIERVLETGDPGGRLGDGGRGELSYLAVRLDQLLINAEELPRRQPDLLANAVGEMDTEFATLRATFKQLANPFAPDARDQAELLSSLRRQLESTARLVDELIGAHGASDPEPTMHARRVARFLRRSPGSILVAASVLSGLALLAAGCGGGSREPPVAHLGATSTTTTQSAPPDPVAQAIRYADCMRSHGVADYPDPQPISQGGHQGVRIKTPDLSSPQARAAAQACRNDRPSGAGANPTPDPQRQAQLLAFARCMRIHGIHDFPDPASTGGFPPSIGRIARESPAFRSALSACQHIAHGAIGLGPNRNPMWPVDR